MLERTVFVVVVSDVVGVLSPDGPSNFKAMDISPLLNRIEAPGCSG